MNGMRVFTVKSVACGVRVQCKFVSNRSLSKHLYSTLLYGSNYALLYVVDVVAEAHNYFIVFIIYSRPFRGYELSLCTSFAKVCRL